MAFGESKLTGCSPRGAQVIRDELVWDKAVFLQKCSHQIERRPIVPPGLDQHIEDLALGVHGTPEVDQATFDLEIDFVEMPDGVGLRRRLRRSAAILGPKWFTQRVPSHRTPRFRVLLANPRRRGSSR